MRIGPDTQRPAFDGGYADGDGDGEDGDCGGDGDGGDDEGT